MKNLGLNREWLSVPGVR